MPHHADRVLAVSIALLLHGTVFWFVARGADQLVAAQDVESPALQIVWIARRSDNHPEKPALKSVTRRQASTRPIASDQVPAPREQLAVALPPPSGSSPITTNDQGPPLTSADLDLRLVDTRPSFRRDPLAHRVEPMETTENQMSLTFTDRSIGGVLQQMTKNSICAELRRSLFSAQGSADAIVNTMRTHGCFR